MYYVCICPARFGFNAFFMWGLDNKPWLFLQVSRQRGVQLEKGGVFFFKQLALFFLCLFENYT